MNRYLSVFLSLMMVALVFLPGPAAAQKVDLKFAPQLNEVLRLQCIIDSNIQTQMPSLPQAQGQAQDQNIVFKGLIEITCAVTAISPEKVVTMDVAVDRLAGDINIPGKPIKVDTKNPVNPNDPVEKVLQALIGQKLTMAMDETGKLLSLSGIDQILETVISNSGMANEPGAAMILPMIRSQVSDKVVSDQLGGMASVYPDHPVGVGDSWSVNQVMAGMQNTQVDGGYTVTKIDDQYVFTDFKGVLNQNITQQVPNGSMVQKQKGTMKGQIRFERSSGLVTDMQMTQDIDGSTQVSGGSTPPITITTKTVQKITLKVR